MSAAAAGMDRSKLMLAVICAGALWWSPLSPRARIEPLRADSAETGRQAAQVALLVLRTTVEGAASTRRFFIRPSRTPLSLDQAARALATQIGRAHV